MVIDDAINSGAGPSSDLNLSFGDPLYLHPHDTSGSPIMTIKSTGTENYKMWSIAMTFALRNHNKLGFIDGTCAIYAKTASEMVLLGILKVLVFCGLTIVDQGLTFDDLLLETSDSCALYPFPCPCLSGFEPISPPANKAHFESEKEVIHMILTGIGDEIYSTVDACNIAHEMWEAIERLQQGESLNIQDVKTNLFWEFGKFTSHNGESIESYYSRFYKLMNEMIRNNLTVDKMQLDEVSYHKFFDILKQYQKEVNELRAERIAKNANPLALVATAQPYQDPYYQTSKSHKSSAPTLKASLPTRSHATTRHKGK
ncbi:hypothetical protein Tco_0901958 [Tanacetum coccineum]